MADLERIRLVVLGGAGVGKSSIVKRFLFKTYTDKYRATVEDLYNREYDLGGATLKNEFTLAWFLKLSTALMTSWLTTAINYVLTVLITKIETSKFNNAVLTALSYFYIS
uniref:Uncharacterized protein n=1 Tax=Glossina austeni TaxID=7395 RepID=A0A1A9VSQ8_GLOAU